MFEGSMSTGISNEREAFLFGQQQIGVVPEQFHQAFLKGARDKAYVGWQNFLDPEIEKAYKKLLSIYKTKSAVAKAMGIGTTNLHNYITGRSSVGPKVKEKFFAALAVIE